MPKSFPAPKFLTTYASERDFHSWIECRSSQQANNHTVAKRKEKKNRYISNIIKDIEELWMKRELDKLKFLSELTITSCLLPKAHLPIVGIS